MTNWQDIAILVVQGAMFFTLISTLRDRTRWPRPGTCRITPIALLAVPVSLLTLKLLLSAAGVLSLASA